MYRLPGRGNPTQLPLSWESWNKCRQDLGGFRPVLGELAAGWSTDQDHAEDPIDIVSLRYFILLQRQQILQSCSPVPPDPIFPNLLIEAVTGYKQLKTVQPTPYKPNFTEPPSLFLAKPGRKRGSVCIQEKDGPGSIGQMQVCESFELL
ncbi:MAG: hypothetical protein P4L51_28435 [Puia sp.]|nr:hypothetical protein [Puia sp.]